MHQEIRVAVIEGLQQDRMDHRKYRGVGSDAQGQREHCRHGKGRVSPQSLQPIEDVLPEHFKKSNLTHAINHLRDKTKFTPE